MSEDAKAIKQFILAEQSKKEGVLDMALEQVNSGLTIQPASYQGLCVRARILEDLGRLNESKSDFLQAISLLSPIISGGQPVSEEQQLAASMYIELGAVCWRIALRDHDDAHWRQARAAYQSAVNLNDSSATAWHGLGASIWRVGRRADARAALEEAVARDPDFVDAYITLFQLEMYSLHFRAALRAFRKGFRLLWEKEQVEH